MHLIFSYKYCLTLSNASKYAKLNDEDFHSNDLIKARVSKPDSLNPTVFFTSV